MNGPKTDAIRVLMLVGNDAHRWHNWEKTTPAIERALKVDPRVAVAATRDPEDFGKGKLKDCDVLLLNYRETKPTPETKWSDANKRAFLDAVKGGKGLVVFHFASSGFNDWPEFEQVIGGGWRDQGFHGPAHAFTVKTAKPDHPIAKGLPAGPGAVRPAA